MVGVGEVQLDDVPCQERRWGVVDTKIEVMRRCMILMGCGRKEEGTSTSQKAAETGGAGVYSLVCNA